jgi:hypothetical protein
MHIHTAQASALGNALAGAQDAETSMSLRRARELRDAATRLKAASFEVISSLPPDPDTAAQTVSMIAAWASGNPGPGSGAGSAVSQPSPSPQEVSSQPQPTQAIQRTPPSSPVNYWA